MCSILLLPFSSSQAQLHVTFSSNTVLESFDVEYVGTRRLPILKSSMQYKIPRIVKSTESESTLVDAGARAGQGGGGGVSGCLVTLFNPRDYSPLASTDCDIFQARILEWVAISSSRGSSHLGTEATSPVSPASQAGSLPAESLGKPIVCLGGGGLASKLCPTLATPWPVAHQAPLSMGFSRHEYWSGLPCPSPRDLPDPGIEPRSPALQADSLPPEL